MFKQYFEQVENIEIFPIIGLVVFGLFFIGLLFWVYMINNRYVKHMSELPLKSDDEDTIENENLDNKKMKIFKS
jgi:cbb3-type cytochrome oxidase subunit 3